MAEFATPLRQRRFAVAPWRPAGDPRRAAFPIVWAVTACCGLVPLACSKREVIHGFPDSFVGVGLELKVEGGYPVVVRPLRGGPGALAGLKPGDVITDVDGGSLRDIGLANAVVRLRGPPESQVSVGVQRDGRRIIFVVRRRPMRKVQQDYEVSEDPQANETPE